MKNKKAIITGGGRGLGKATAMALAKEGVAIAITGRNEKILKATVAELKELGVPINEGLLIKYCNTGIWLEHLRPVLNHHFFAE